MIKILKTMFSIMGAMVVFGVIVHVLDYMYVAPVNGDRERVFLHQFYEDKGKIDNLYLGSSHVYYGINSLWLNEASGQYNFNLATPSQFMNGTFYLLKEANRYNDLSHVYVDLYYYVNVKPNALSNDERMYQDYYRNWQNTDYMKFSMNKLKYMLSIAEPEKYINIWIPFTRYRTELGNWNYIKQTIEGKQADEYINYKYSTDRGEYWGNGYIYTSRTLADGEKIYGQRDILEESPMGKKTEQYLCKVINYCQQRNIPITLFVAPMYELQVISTEHYDNYANQIKRISREYNVPFYDFNLAKEEYLPIQYGEYFYDLGHLNCNGSSVFTSFFYEVASGDESDNEKFFYDSYAEKLQNAAPEIYGIYYRDSENAAEGEEPEEPMLTYWVASNREVGMEYRIIITPEEGEQYMIQDFNENKEFTIPREERGICTIVARMKDTSDEVQTLEINLY